MDTSLRGHILSYEEPNALRQHLAAEHGLHADLGGHREMDQLHIRAHRDNVSAYCDQRAR